MRILTKRAAAAMTLLAVFILSWNRAYAQPLAPPTSTVQVADETMTMLLSADTDANNVWHSLSQEKQDAVLQNMFPEEFAQGMRPELMALSNPGVIGSTDAPGQSPQAPGQ